jgi:hypothetical protein
MNIKVRSHGGDATTRRYFLIFIKDNFDPCLLYNYVKTTVKTFAKQHFDFAEFAQSQRTITAHAHK